LTFLFIYLKSTEKIFTAYKKTQGAHGFPTGSAFPPFNRKCASVLPERDRLLFDAVLGDDLEVDGIADLESI
jgi:hypothetical protein